MKNPSKLLVIGLVVITISLSACTMNSPAPTDLAATAANQTLTAPTETSLASPTSTATETPPPDTATPTQPPAPTSTPAPVGPDTFPQNVNPLTGLPVTDPKLLERRPIGIKVNIFPREQYRPTWGLSLADIVYDYYHNNGYSRFHAIFYGQDAELAGAIRSGRLLDEDLVRMYKSIFVYGGADERIDRVFWSSDFADRLVREGSETLCPPTAEKPLCRYEPSGVSNLLAGTTQVHEYVQAKGVEDIRQDLAGMLFDFNLPSGGIPGVQASVRYSMDDYNRWEYDQASGKYQRLQDAQLDPGGAEQFTPLTDRVTEEQIRAENVVILFASHENTNPKAKTEIYDINLSGTGKAYAFRDGQAYEVQWNRPIPSSVLYLTFPDGSRYPYKPGSTWYQVVGLYSQVEDQGDGNWQFVLGIP
jgi:hypothetical protein